MVPGPDVPGPRDQEEPPGFDQEYDDPALWDGEWEAMEAEVARIEAGRAADARFLARGDTAELAGAAAAAGVGSRGRRGPGLPGSARPVPGESASQAGGFGSGQCLDVAPGGAAGFAGRVHQTVPLATLLDLAERPGELPGLGPVDPNPEANT